MEDVEVVLVDGLEYNGCIQTLLAVRGVSGKAKLLVARGITDMVPLYLVYAYFPSQRTDFVH